MLIRRRDFQHLSGASARRLHSTSIKVHRMPARGAILVQVVYLDKYLVKYGHAMHFCNPAGRDFRRAAPTLDEMTRAYQESAA